MLSVGPVLKQKKKADVYSKHKSGRSTMRSDHMNVAEKGYKRDSLINVSMPRGQLAFKAFSSHL